MAAVTFHEISNSLQQLYVDDPRPWLIGFSGGKDSTLVAALVFDAVMSIAPEQRTKPVTVLCTDTRVEIPAIAEGVESALDRMRRCSQQNNLNIEAHLLKPPPEQSFWVNIIGRGYPPPNRIFRWCTQRLKIDPVTSFVQKRMGDGHWTEAILHLGARRAESSTRAQTMAGREKRNGLNRHPDLPRVWVSNPIEFLTTEEVWAYLLQKPNPWGGDNRPLYKLYASASNGECPIQIDTSTPSCGRFSLSASTGERAGVRCRNPLTCTVVERDKASEGLLASGDERMEHLIAFRETLLEFQDPANGRRDMKGMTARISHKRAQRSQRTGGANVFTLSASIGERAGVRCRNPVAFRTPCSQFRICPANRLREFQEQIAAEKGTRADALRRLLAKVDEFSESHRAFGLPDDLLSILKDDLAEHGETVLN